MGEKGDGILIFSFEVQDTDTPGSYLPCLKGR